VCSSLTWPLVPPWNSKEATPPGIRTSFTLTTTRFRVLEYGVADQNHFNADPDLSFHSNADPDPTFHLNFDPDPDRAMLFIKVLRPPINRPVTVLFEPLKLLIVRPPRILVQLFTLMRMRIQTLLPKVMRIRIRKPSIIEAFSSLLF
jgi:hypothetical protein